MNIDTILKNAKEKLPKDLYTDITGFDELILEVMSPNEEVERMIYKLAKADGVSEEDMLKDSERANDGNYYGISLYCRYLDKLRMLILLHTISTHLSREYNVI